MTRSERNQGDPSSNNPNNNPNHDLSPRTSPRMGILKTSAAAGLLILITTLWGWSTDEIAVPPVASPPASVTPTGQSGSAEEAAPRGAGTTAPGAHPFSFDPATIKLGDGVGNWKVSSRELETYGTGSISISFTGSEELSGTFEYTDRRHEYNAGAILLTLDEASKAKLPAFTKPFVNSIDQVVLYLPADLLRDSFGEPGRGGKAKIKVSGYRTISAEILEGVTEQVHVSEVLAVSLDPVKPALEPAASLMNVLKPFPALTLGNDPKAADANAVYSWMEQISKHYIDSMSALSQQVQDESVSPALKEQTVSWLSSVMTEELAAEQLGESFMKVHNGYVLYPGILSLIPPVIIQKVENPSIQAESKTRYVYTAKLIVSGTNDYALRCVLVNEGGVWKIESVSSNPI